MSFISYNRNHSKLNDEVRTTLQDFYDQADECRKKNHTACTPSFCASGFHVLDREGIESVTITHVGSLLADFSVQNNLTDSMGNYWLKWDDWNKIRSKKSGKDKIEEKKSLAAARFHEDYIRSNSGKFKKPKPYRLTYSGESM